MTQRQYESWTLFNLRAVDMRHLWVPSDTFKGQKQQKPNYFAGFITPKTQAQWHAEPALAGLTQALMKLHAGQGANIVDWRIEDGDLPNAEGKSSEFAKGHWLFNASSSAAPNVELVQAGGQLVKLANKTGVKPGDYCMVGGSAAVSGQNNRAAKLYLNAVVFSAPGEEIVFANTVSGAELMQQAQRQGLNVAGFAGAPGFGGGAPGGFGQPGAPGFGGPAAPGPNAAPAFGQPGGAFAPPNGGLQQPGGFNPQPGFTPGAVPGAQTTPGAFAAPATAPNGPAFGGGAAFPSNPGGFPGR